MQIRVHGIKDEKITRKEVLYATRWMSELLMGKRLMSKIDLTVAFRNIPNNGLCGPIDDERFPREFEILLRKGTSRLMALKNLAHELVHVKQFARRELVDLGEVGKTKFLGKNVCEKKTHYYDTPWEIEAYGREIGLYTRYMDHLKEDKALRKVLLKG